MDIRAAHASVGADVGMLRPHGNHHIGAGVHVPRTHGGHGIQVTGEPPTLVVEHVMVKGKADPLAEGRDPAQRARDLLDEIRRRSGQQDRPEDERDYLGRLLDRF